MKSATGFPKSLIVVVTLLFLPPVAKSDWVNTTGAETAANLVEMHLSEEGLRVFFEISPPDAASFVVDEVLQFEVAADSVAIAPVILAAAIRPPVDRTSLYTANGRRSLKSDSTAVSSDSGVVYLEVGFPFEEPPARIRIKPPANKEGMALSVIGFTAFHDGLPVTDMRFMSTELTLQPDWADPWQTRFKNTRLTRYFQTAQRSYLYIEPRNVRHDMLLRTVDVMAQIGMPLLPELDADAQQRLRLEASEYFKSVNPVTIDDALSGRSTHRLEFLAITPAGLRVLQPTEPVNPLTTYVGVSEAHWQSSLPGSVVIHWQLFDAKNDQLWTNMTDPAGPFPVLITSESPNIEWRNFLKNYSDPEVAPVEVAPVDYLSAESLLFWFTGVPDQERAVSVTQRLLVNTKFAFLNRNEDVLRQKLALLATDAEVLQVPLSKCFALPTLGGGIADVVSIDELSVTDIKAIESDAGDGFRALVSWRSPVSGQHWGHVDKRVLQYRALVDIVETDGSWQLAGFTPMEIRELVD